MKFGDKLIALRKRSGLSQEELAEKLKVSRQSVSKWESNNTYPETDKIVQIANLFDCTMDDLINDKITDINQIERANNKNINKVVESFLDFITKTINMFSSMNVLNIFKCLLELTIIISSISLIGVIIISIIINILSNMFSFIPYETSYIIINVLKSFLTLFYLLISIIIIIHIFKLRYLNYYDDYVKEEQKQPSETKKIKFIKKEKEIIIRDPKHESFAFLSLLSKIIIYFVKILIFFIVISLLILLLPEIISIIILIPLSITQLFIGILISLLSITIITILTIYYLTLFLINRKRNTKLYLIIFLIFFIFSGIGIGISILGFSKFEIIESNELMNQKTNKETIKYQENLIINYIENNKYITNDKLKDDEIIIKTNYDSKIQTIEIDENTYQNMNYLTIYTSNNINISYIYDEILKDIKNNKIYLYKYYDNNTNLVIANQKTLNKLLSNYSKVYLYTKKDTKAGFILTNIEEKINITTGTCEVEYNALKQELFNYNNCNCTLKKYNTTRGKKIEYYCQNINEIKE